MLVVIKMGKFYGDEINLIDELREKRRVISLYGCACVVVVVVVPWFSGLMI